MDGPPFLVDIRINNHPFTHALVDNGCLCYATVSESYAFKLQLPRIDIPPRPLDGVVPGIGQVSHIAYGTIDVHGHQQERIFFYIIPGQTDDVVLGNPWLKEVDGHYSARKGYLDIRSTGIRCWNRARPSLGPQGVRPLKIAEIFTNELIRELKQPNVQVYAVTLSDIEKALRPKTKTDPRTKLPKHYWKWLSAFDRKLADLLPPHRPGVDHEIPLQKDDQGKEKPPPFGALYGMNREELLVLRKTLTDLLDKNFIRVSNSPAAAPVLLVRKAGSGGVRFCVDYRGLNAITTKDRYPLPLIRETLRNISKAKWFTKLDIIFAFHKVRMSQGEEWKTAFRTRYGLFEWLVMPFGLTGAPATFQRYVNHLLRDYLDDFLSAYMDDILIYSEGTLEDHRTKVGLVLERLQTAGLQCDIEKSEFEVKQVKYLGFIINAGQGITVDPDKVAAIRAWERPTNVKGVRSFLGFANFYRIFIPDFAVQARPLTNLTKKEALFRWTEDCQKAFENLKEQFISAPILVHFDPDKETIVEADASGYAVGGVLSQRGKDGLLRPCAYFSQKLSPAECNYPIHDKELLAIVRCLEEWRPELKMGPKFTILTDHRNLKYFQKAQFLNERQMRWADLLTEFHFELQYRPGKLADRPDALSRREQDMPAGKQDERLSTRFRTLLGTAIPVTVQPTQTDGNEDEAPLNFTNSVPLFHEEELQQLWEDARTKDTTYQQLSLAVRKGSKKLDPKLNIMTSLSECSLDSRGLLCFRKRVWIPDSEPLRTKIIQNTHDSYTTGHPGRDGTYAILSRQFFWPGAARDVRRFLRNCTICGRSTIWREQKHGLLKPLPIPNRIWAEISIDFITDLPLSGPNGATNCMVITDRLTKGVILVAMDDISTSAVAEQFVLRFYAYHGLPYAITSDRGPQFVSGMWERICELLKIRRRLSTGYHPQTDGATERANQEVEKILRILTTYVQDDWSNLLPVVTMAINNREAASTGLSPFFFTHGYHVEPVAIDEQSLTASQGTGKEAGELFVRRLQEAQEWAQAAVAAAQDRQEEAANRSRKPSPVYSPGDSVWLDLRNVKTDRPSKKLDWLHAKYHVRRVISSHAVELDVPQGIHPVFHVDLLRPVATDPLPSQQVDDVQPPAIQVEGSNEWEVEAILCAKWKKIGRGRRRVVFVQWKGYAQPTWEPLAEFENTQALDDFEATFGHAATNDGPLDQYEALGGRKRVRRGPRTRSTTPSGGRGGE